MKICKKIISGFAAAVMAASCMGIGASAAYKTASLSGGYTMTYTSAQDTYARWKMTTSINKASTSVSVSGTGYYYTSSSSNSSKVAAASNGDGSSTSGITCYLITTLNDGRGYGWYKCSSTHKTSGVTKTISTTGKHI